MKILYPISPILLLWCQVAFSFCHFFLFRTFFSSYLATLDTLQLSSSSSDCCYTKSRLYIIAACPSLFFFLGQAFIWCIFFVLYIKRPSLATIFLSIEFKFLTAQDITNVSIAFFIEPVTTTLHMNYVTLTWYDQ